MGQKTIKDEYEAAKDASYDRIMRDMDLYAQIADDEAAQKARDESLRIALITNEINAGRVSETAGIYRKFLSVHTVRRGSVRIICPDSRVKALEHAAKIGYVSAEETIEAAEEFAKHLSGQNERVCEVR